MTKRFSIAETEGRRGFWEAYEEFRREFDLGALGSEPDEIFADVRDSSPGREFSW